MSVAARLPFSIPNIAAGPTFTLPLIEEQLLDFTENDLWIQPDLGNVLVSGGTTRIMNRKGIQDAQATSASVTIGTGLAGNVPTINFDGTNASGASPLHVPEYELGGSYFMAAIVSLAADYVSSNVARIASVGVSGSSTDVEWYLLNNAILLRHGDVQSSLGGASAANQLLAGQTKLLWASYDARANEAYAGVNSIAPRAWTADNLTGAAGTGRELVIGSAWNADRSQPNQTLKGKIRAFWAARAPWGAPDYDDIRGAFLSLVAALYPSDVALT